jgi:hypothetical protein
MTMYYPDSVESVALELFRIIKEAEPKEAHGQNIPESARLLSLFAECLSAATGQRRAPSTQLLQ